MFDHKHYLSILKTKAGERWALENVDFPLRTKMTPLLEIHPPKNRKKGEAKSNKKKKKKSPETLNEHIQAICASIKDFWGPNPFFLDTEWVNDMHVADSALAVALEACRSNGLKAIPVVRFSLDDKVLDAAKTAIELDNRGCMLRLDPDDFGAQAAINGVLDYLNLHAAEVHLLMDYGKNPMNLADDVKKVPSINDWKTFSAASAAFPKTIKNLPQRTWIKVPRYDWTAWEQAVTRGALPRKPTFGDYATRCSGAPPGGGDPFVHLRYTKDQDWIVLINGTLQSGDADKMPSICRSLIERSDFDGYEFSKGDSAINWIAGQNEDTGGPTEWVQWCANHHLQYVIKQIQSRSDL
jgi:hypothetical protein